MYRWKQFKSENGKFKFRLDFDDDRFIEKESPSLLFANCLWSVIAGKEIRGQEEYFRLNLSCKSEHFSDEWLYKGKAILGVLSSDGHPDCDKLSVNFNHNKTVTGWSKFKPLNFITAPAMKIIREERSIQFSLLLQRKDSSGLSKNLPFHWGVGEGGWCFLEYFLKRVLIQ